MENVWLKRNGVMVSAKDILKEKLAANKEVEVVEEKVVAPVEVEEVVEEVDSEETVTVLDVLRKAFKAKFEKDVPVNKKNDAEWIKSKLEE